ncbi:hypothetical protein LCGC14_2997780, partial [marine sediment metagenome]
MSKRQRTTWRYSRRFSGKGAIQVGWVHNPNYEPKEDIVRVKMMNSPGTYYFDTQMTVMEALSLAAGINLTVQH